MICAVCLMISIQNTRQVKVYMDMFCIEVWWESFLWLSQKEPQSTSKYVINICTKKKNNTCQQQLADHFQVVADVFLTLHRVNAN